MDIGNSSTKPYKYEVKDAIIVTILYVIAALVVAFPVALLGSIAKTLGIQSTQLNAWVAVVSTIITFVAIFYAVNKIYGKGAVSKRLFVDRQIDWTVYALIFMATISLVVVLEPISTLLLKLWPMGDWWKNLFNQSFTPSVTTFIMVAILAPLFEEILMRGVVLRGLLNGGTSPRNAIIWSSLLFALIHMNPWQAVPAFIIGLLLGWIYWKTRSIWPSIFIHFVNNLVGFIGLLIVDSKGLSITDTTLEDLAGGYFSSIFVVAAVLLIVTFGLLRKRYKLKKESAML